MSRHEWPVGAVRLRVFLLFHLNLGLSTLEAEDRATVITRCYEPMLDLAEGSGQLIAVEASGWHGSIQFEARRSLRPCLAE